MGFGKGIRLSRGVGVEWEGDVLGMELVDEETRLLSDKGAG